MQHPHLLHCFRPSETIEAVLRLKGRHNYTKEELRYLVKVFNELNGEILPRPGMTLKVPILTGSESEGGETD